MTAFLRATVTHGLRNTFPIRKNKERLDFSWWFLPYCLSELKDGQLIVLNRAYKPLGVRSREWVDYDSPEFNYAKVSASQVDLTPLKARGGCSVLGDYVHHFYDDSCSPRYKNSYAIAYVALVERVFSPLISQHRGAK